MGSPDVLVRCRRGGASSTGRSVVGRSTVRRRSIEFGFAGIRCGDGRSVAGPLGIERFEDASADALLQLEKDPDPGEIHPSLTREVADPHDPADVVLAIEPDVGGSASRAEETLVFVDPQCPRMHADDARRYADHVDGSLGIPLGSG